MKKLALITLASFAIGFSYAGDILTLNDKHRYDGKVTKIRQCMVTFRTAGSRSRRAATRAPRSRAG